MYLGFGGISRISPSPSLFLHLQKAIAEGVRAEIKMGAGETFAVPETEIHFSLRGAIQDRTDPAQKPQLGGQFPRGLFRSAGTAGAAAALHQKFTSQTVDSAGTGTIHFLSFKFLKIFSNNHYNLAFTSKPPVSGGSRKLLA
jgi:hypothetical protein